ncbi:MAG: hypothetical protein K2L93_08905, partial [Muribaculaceae bacterium]|nr:hypothetical protein [Muribaculaceae bacterium]
VRSPSAPDGAMGHEHASSTSQLDPAAYNGVREHTFGPVTVAGSIADGSATVAFVEKIIANDQALTESLRLWRIYGIFDPSAPPTARYSDLCVIDQYPYVTIFPDVNTQVALATLTCSITDNSDDVPYFYTSRSATQQVKQRLTTPVQPAASLTGISLATIGDDTYFLYASKPGEVVLTQVGDPAEGFADGNLRYIATLTMSATNATAPSKPEVCIATAAVDNQLAVALYTQGRALALYRHGSGNNGVGEEAGLSQPPFGISGTAVTAFVPLEAYDLLGRKKLKLAEGATASLPAGAYVIRCGADTQVVALR